MEVKAKARDSEEGGVRSGLCLLLIHIIERSPSYHKQVLEHECVVGVVGSPASGYGSRRPLHSRTCGSEETAERTSADDARARISTMTTPLVE